MMQQREPLWVVYIKEQMELSGPIREHRRGAQSERVHEKRGRR